MVFSYFYSDTSTSPTMTLTEEIFREKTNSQNGVYFFTYEPPDVLGGISQWYIKNPYVGTSQPVNLLEYGINITGESAVHDLIYVDAVEGSSSAMLMQKRRNLSLMLHFRPAYLAAVALISLKPLGDGYLSNLLKPRIT